MVVGLQSPDHSAASRLFDALFVSIVFDAIYLLILLFSLGWTGSNAVEKSQQFLASLPDGSLALMIIILMLIVPAVTGYFLSARFKRIEVLKQDGSSKKRVLQVNRARSTPRAWDHAAFRAFEASFVRIRMEDGRYYGGWFDADSLVSTYPFSRDIFIAVAWNMNEFGEFLEEAPNTRGIWVPITDSCVVEWISATEELGGD